MEISFVLSSVALVWSIAVITPGPNFFITVQTAINKSHRSALFVVLGIGLGTIVWAVCGFLGIMWLFRSAPWVYLALKIIGGAYLVFLGTKLLLAKPEPPGQEKIVRTGQAEPLRSLRLGLVTNLSNPKTATFMASLFAASMPANASLTLGIASIALIFLISLGWYTLVACVFSLNPFRALFQKARTWVDRVAGAIFIGFGVKLACRD